MRDQSRRRLTDDLLQVIELRAPNDGCGHIRLSKSPRSRNLGHAQVVLLCDLFDSEADVSFRA